MGRWLVVVSLHCDDLPALQSIRALVEHAAAIRAVSLQTQANVFNAPPHDDGVGRCATLEALRSDTERAYALSGVTSVAGFKTSAWRALSPEFTAPYDLVWLKDSDVLVDAHLFSFLEVEHWMARTGAAVAQPTVVPLDGRSKSHGWWTPFRAAFHASCLVASSPIVEQMTPILTRRAFDGLRSLLWALPAELLRTDAGDFGLETLWCVSLHRCVIDAPNLRHIDARPRPRHERGGGAWVLHGPSRPGACMCAPLRRMSTFLMLFSRPAPPAPPTQVRTWPRA
jgi:hypothetical protein